MAASLQIIKTGKDFGTGINPQQLCNTQQLQQDKLRRCAMYNLQLLMWP